MDDAQTHKRGALIMTVWRAHQRFASFALRTVVLGLVLVYTLGPIATIFAESLFPRQGRTMSEQQHLTFQAYHDALGSGTIQTALFNSLIIAAIVAIISGVLGFMSARLVRGLSTPLALGFMTALSIPALLPAIVSGFSLHVYYQLIGIDGTLLGILAAHVIYVSPIAFFLLYIAQEGLNPETEDCARNLGATEAQIAVLIAFPQLKSAFVATSTICGLISWNEFIITWFVSGFQKTLPTWVYGMLGGALDPSLHAMGTIVTLLSLVLIAFSALVMRDQIIYGLARR